MTDLRQGEHLQGAVLRAAASNGLASIDPIVELAGTSTFRRLSAFTSLKDGDEIGRLVDVLGIKPSSSFLREVLKAPGAHTREHVSFFGHVIRRAHILPNRRVSPRALAVHGHQRAIWSLRPFEFDPTTREMLLAHCPVCEMALGWEKTVGVVYCESCPRRTVDLRDFPQPLVQSDDGEAVSFVGDLVNPEVTDLEYSKWKLPALAPTSRGDLFQLVVKIASESQRADTGFYSTSLQFKHLERAGRAVLGWPNSFVELAETLVRDDRTAECGLKELSLWRLRYDLTIAADLRQQIKILYRSSKNRSVAAFPTVAKGEPSECRNASLPGPLKTPRSELNRLLKRRHLGSYVNDIDARVKLLRTIPEVQHVSLLLGLPVFDVYELYSEGLLPELRAVLTDNGLSAPTRQSEISVWQVINGVPYTDSPGSNVSLPSFRFAMDIPLSIPWSRVLRAISKQRTGLSRSRASASGVMNDIYLTDFTNMDCVLSLPADDYLSPGLSLTQGELGYLMGKSRSAAARFVELTGSGRELTLGRVRLERRHWITSFELRILMQRHGNDPVEMMEDLRRSQVAVRNTKGVYLWAREEALDRFGLRLADASF